MADEVIDIVHNLTYNVNGQNLKEAITSIQGNANEITKLEVKIKSLSAAYAALSKSNNPNADKIKKQLDENIEKRDKERLSIEKTISSNKKLQDQVNKEIGLIGQLNKKLDELKTKRASIPSGANANSSIASINKEIAVTQTQLNSLLTVSKNAGPGVLAQIFGGSSSGGIGRQILQGVLQGAGIGAGFGIITKGVSALLGELSKTDVGIQFAKGIEKIGDNLHGTTKFADELKGAISSLKNEIKGLIDEYENLTVNAPGSPNSVSSFRRIEEQAKSLGIFNLKQADADKRDLQNRKVTNLAEQLALQQSITIRENTVKQLDALNKKLIDADAASEQYKANALNYLNSKDPNRADTEANRQAENTKSIASIKAQFSPNSETIKGLNLTTEKLKEYSVLYNNITTQIGKVAKGEATSITDVTQQAIDFITKYSKEASISLEDAKSKAIQIENEYQAKIRQANDAEIQKSNRAIRDENNKFRSEEIQNLVHFGKETVDRIKERNNLERQLALDKVNDAQKDFENANVAFGAALDPKVLKGFNDQRLQITKEYNEKYQVEYADFYNSVIDERNKFYQDILSGEIEHLTQLQRTLDRSNTVDLNLLLVQNEESRALDLKKNSDDLESQNRHNVALLSQLKKTGKEKTDEYVRAQNEITQYTEKSRKKQQDINDKYDALEIEKINSFFKKQDEIIDKQSKNKISEIRATSRGTSNTNGNILQANLDDAIFKRINAEANLKAIKKNAKSTQDEIDDAQRKLNDTIVGVKEAKAAIRNSILDDVKTITQSVGQMVSIIGSALNEVYAQQEKLLDVQAQAQQSRVDFLVKTSDRGNAEILRQEQNRLNEIQKQREENARKQLSINKALQISNAALAASEAIIAIIKAAGNTGSTAGIIGFVAAIVAGLAAVGGLIISARSAFSGSDSFADGVVDYQGKGTKRSDSNVVRISRGESVITADATEKYAPLLMAMNAGIPITKHIEHDGFATKGEFRTLGKKLDILNETMSVNSTTVHTNFTSDGMRQIVEKSQKADQNLWS